MQSPATLDCPARTSPSLAASAATAPAVLTMTSPATLATAVRMSAPAAASMEPMATSSAGLRTLQSAYRSVRARSIALVAPLSAEDACAQSMPDASPAKWHLAHTTWFFETFILERFDDRYVPHHPAFRVLFNSYYNGVGERHLRAHRGLLTRPAHAEVLAYRAEIDHRIEGLLADTLQSADTGRRAQIATLVKLGLEHEQQHQELILTDVLHLLSMNPLAPAYAPAAPAMIAPVPMPMPMLTPIPTSMPMQWLAFGAGVVQIGCAASAVAADVPGPFCFDNETPRHRQYLEAYALASRLVTNGEYLAFVNAGGYRDPALWLSEGWDWIRQHQLQHPLYWQRADAAAAASAEASAETSVERHAEATVASDAQANPHPGVDAVVVADADAEVYVDASGWQQIGLAGLQRLDPRAPLTHISLYEADAYARWRGARLPTEAEWEHAASTRIADLTQVDDTCWQWTLSSYAPYPGYAPLPGALGEYNGKFMVNQYVLRGGSRATPPGHSRITYRNFFPATTRWQFSGIRLARSLPVPPESAAPSVLAVPSTPPQAR